MAGKKAGAVDHKALQMAVLGHLRERSGRIPKWDVVTELFPDVSKATIYRARDEVLKRHPELARNRKGREIPRETINLPPDNHALTTHVASPFPTGSGVKLGVLGTWSETLDDTIEFIKYFGPQKENGKPRNPRFHLDGLTLKAKIAGDMLKAMKTLWTIDRIQFLYDTIIKHLHGRDPELARAVLSDIEKAHREAGITIDSVRL